MNTTNREPSWDQLGCYADDNHGDYVRCDGVCGLNHPAEELSQLPGYEESFCAPCMVIEREDETQRIAVESMATVVDGRLR